MSNRIFISGLTAVGKTTHSNLVALDYELKYVSASSFLLQKMNLDCSNLPKNFWVSPDAARLRSERAKDLSVDKWVDQRMIKAVEDLDKAVFDTWALPWLTDKAGLRICLESSTTARWWKAIISHGPESQMKPEEVLKGLEEKDRTTREYFLSSYGFDIFHDRNVFDYVIDITDFITAPTLEASRVSIARVQEIVETIVDYYYSSFDDDLRRIGNLFARYGRGVFVKAPDRVIEERDRQANANRLRDTRPIKKVGAVILNDRKQILVVRKFLRPQSEFIIPGGRKERDEPDEETLARELREELGITIKSCHFFGHYEETAIFENVPLLMDVYRVEIEGEPKPNSEIKECAWIGRDYEAQVYMLGTVLSRHVIPRLVNEGLM